MYLNDFKVTLKLMQQKIVLTSNEKEKPLLIECDMSAIAFHSGEMNSPTRVSHQFFFRFSTLM